MYSNEDIRPNTIMLVFAVFTNGVSFLIKKSCGGFRLITAFAGVRG